MKNKLIVVKIGGKIIENESLMNRFLKSFSKIKDKKILIHGGGKIVSDFLKKIDIEPKVINGRRITDNKTLDIVTMIYAGLINKKIISKLQSFKCNSLGLSGPDCNLILATKREVKKIDYGFAGDIEKINTSFLKQILNMNICPVICSLTHNEEGQLLNTNADTIASKISIELSKKFNISLNYCFDKSGVLINNKTQNLITTKDYKKLVKKNIIVDGMIPKIENCFSALQNGVNEVYIGDHKVINSKINCTKLTL